MLIAHHGTLTMSPRGLVDAYQRLEVLDSWCQILLGVARLGTVEVLTDAQLADVLALRGGRDDRTPCFARSVSERNRAALPALGVLGRSAPSG
jgi:hypothetical protein